MEEAETIPHKDLRAVQVRLTQIDKQNFVGECGEFRFIAQMNRLGSPENMGGGRIKRFSMVRMQKDTKNLEVADYDCGWEKFPSKEDEILMFTFIRFSLEKVDPKELADQS